MSSARPRSKQSSTKKKTSALVAWMEDEYLSEVVLNELAPAPGTKTEVVSFTWWLYGTGGPSRVPYRLTARGVTTWALKGELDTLRLQRRARNSDR